MDIREGELKVIGRLVDASNATLLCEIEGIDSTPVKVIYKPRAGERPLWDFPDGNLAGREVAAYLLSELLSLKIVPETVLRDGPFGLGSVQRWVDIDEEMDLTFLASSLSSAVRKIAFFDILLNNTDRKFGHLLPLPSGEILGCDHGLTFHAEDKLRTVLWQFSETEIDAEESLILRTVLSDLSFMDFCELITEAEFEALINRAEKFLKEGRFPAPREEWPAIPWPPF